MAGWTISTNIIFLTLICISKVKSNLVVNSPSGPIRGITVQGFTSKEVDAFYAIPYAKPPIGPLRFAPPIEIETWTEEFNASDYHSPACYPRLFGDVKIINGRWPWSEDCLKIHIWVPKPRPKNATVMVYIHGGGFVSGDPLEDNYQGATLAAEENIIVVSMNYRLHIQGFLYLGKPLEMGNVGLIDQQMALKWVRRNIASFGGNPDEVTLFGMSAGGASVGYHILAPKSEGLFRRAILMSGTPVGSWASTSEDEISFHSRKFAEDMGCLVSDLSKVLNCLLTIHPDNFLKWNPGPLSRLGPTRDGQFIPDYPRKLMEDNRINLVDIMIGTTKDEGSLIMFLDYPEIANFPDAQLTKENFQKMLDTVLSPHSESFRKNLSAIYSHLYTQGVRNDTEDPYELRDRMKDIFSDYLFICPSQEFADFFVEKTNNHVYRYVVDHNFGYVNSSSNLKWSGTYHSSDTLLHLGRAAGGHSSFHLEGAVHHFFNQGDIDLSKKVMKWWANFARTGNPNSDGQSFGEWPVSTKNQEYLRISINPKVENRFRQAPCDMMKRLLRER